MSTVTGGAKKSPLGVALDSIRETTTLLHDKTDILMDKLAPVRLQAPQTAEGGKSDENPASEVVKCATEQNDRLHKVVGKIQQLIDEIEV